MSKLQINKSRSHHMDRNKTHLDARLSKYCIEEENTLAFLSFSEILQGDNQG